MLFGSRRPQGGSEQVRGARRQLQMMRRDLELELFARTKEERRMREADTQGVARRTLGKEAVAAIVQVELGEVTNHPRQGKLQRRGGPSVGAELNHDLGVRWRFNAHVTPVIAP